MEMMESGLDHYHPAVCTIVMFIVFMLSTISEENLALSRPTTQSDILWSYGPDLAVDGDPNTCSFTSREQGEQRWWQVSSSLANSVRHSMSVLENDCGTLN